MSGNTVMRFVVLPAVAIALPGLLIIAPWLLPVYVFTMLVPTLLYLEVSRRRDKVKGKEMALDRAANPDKYVYNTHVKEITEERRRDMTFRINKMTPVQIEELYLENILYFLNLELWTGRALSQIDTEWLIDADPMHTNGLGRCYKCNKSRPPHNPVCYVCNGPVTIGSKGAATNHAFLYDNLEYVESRMPDTFERIQTKWKHEGQPFVCVNCVETKLTNNKFCTTCGSQNIYLKKGFFTATKRYRKNVASGLNV